MDSQDLKTLISEAEVTRFTDDLLRIIFCLKHGIGLEPDNEEIVDEIDSIISYLNIKNQIES